MAFNSAGSLNCSLTRFLQEVSALESGNDRAELAAIMLIYLGFFQHGQKRLDDADLKKLAKILAAWPNPQFPADIQKHCFHCPANADCPVGKIVLKV